METVRTEQEQKKQVTHAEATRYMNNAMEMLQKANKEDNFYLDKKYVRAACGIAYSGMLLALDMWLELKGVKPPKKYHKSILFYKDNVAKIDHKLLIELQVAYEVLHIAGYYEGIQKVTLIKEGFDAAYNIIARIKPEHELTPDELKAIEAQRKPTWMRAMYSFFLA
jgi:hypothetical protein